jgi:hypothetical protein
MTSLWAKVKSLVDARSELRSNRVLIREQQEALQRAKDDIAEYSQRLKAWEEWGGMLNPEEKRGCPKSTGELKCSTQMKRPN